MTWQNLKKGLIYLKSEPHSNRAEFRPRPRECDSISGWADSQDIEWPAGDATDYITIQNLLKEDLVDEMIITKVPILLGGGVSLFEKLTQSKKFNHKKTEIHGDSLVMSYYTRDR